jgi:hypothetical protein
MHRFAAPRLALAAALCSLAARAQDEQESPYYWERGKTRPFVSVAPALGAVSNVDVAIGYGKPHWMWGGIEPTAISTFDFAAVAGGPRLAFIVADLTFKRRQTWAYSHAFLPRRDVHDGSDVEDGNGDAAEYGAWDLSLNGVIPTPVGLGLYELAATFVDGVPSGQDLFEEYQRVVVRGNSIFVVRAGFGAWLITDKLMLGALGEWLTAEDRGDTWRVGPLIDWTLTDHLSATAIYTVPVSSPDELGWWTGGWGTLRLRYAWASAEPNPTFP